MSVGRVDQIILPQSEPSSPVMSSIQEALTFQDEPSACHFQNATFAQCLQATSHHVTTCHYQGPHSPFDV